MIMIIESVLSLTYSIALSMILFSIGVWTICLVLTICKLEDTMFHYQNIRYVFHKVSLMILKMLQQLVYSYVLKCERQESYDELVLWQSKAMHHCLRSELLFHLL